MALPTAAFRCIGDGMAIDDDIAADAARAFAREVATQWQAELGQAELGAGLLGIYLLGSLAHGGFSRRYSDIDIGIVTEALLSSATRDDLRATAARVSAELGAKVSIFFTDRSFAVGRFPPLDRSDYLDHAQTLYERERVVPSRPTLEEVRAYLSGPPFARWAEGATRFASADELAPSDRKSYLRALLYPARFIYSFMTGRMASNDEAVAFIAKRGPPGLDVGLVTRALACRQAGDDPDALFPARTLLPRQVAACEHFIHDSAHEGS